MGVVPGGTASPSMRARTCSPKTPWLVLEGGEGAAAAVLEASRLWPLSYPLAVTIFPASGCLARTWSYQCLILCSKQGAFKPSSDNSLVCCCRFNSTSSALSSCHRFHNCSYLAATWDHEWRSRTILETCSSSENPIAIPEISAMIRFSTTGTIACHSPPNTRAAAMEEKMNEAAMVSFFQRV